MFIGVFKMIDFDFDMILKFIKFNDKIKILLLLCFIFELYNGDIFLVLELWIVF